MWILVVNLFPEIAKSVAGRTDFDFLISSRKDFCRAHDNPGFTLPRPQRRAIIRPSRESDSSPLVLSASWRVRGGLWPNRSSEEGVEELDDGKRSDALSGESGLPSPLLSLSASEGWRSY